MLARRLCLLGVLMAIYHAFFFTPPTPEQERRVITRNRISLANVMPMAYREKIARVPGVREVTVSQWFGGVYKEPQNMFGRMGTEPERFATIFPEYKLTPEERKAWISDKTGCIIGKDTARKVQPEASAIAWLLQGDIFPVNLEFVVRGILTIRWITSRMYFNIQYLFESVSIGRRDFAGIFVR